MENFDNVKVGDEVAVCIRSGKHIKKVDKVTPKRFKIGSAYFNKKDGCIFGSSYHISHCEILTDELREEIAHSERIGKMRTKLCNVNMYSFNSEQVEKLYAFMVENSLIIDN